MSLLARREILSVLYNYLRSRGLPLPLLLAPFTAGKGEGSEVWSRPNPVVHTSARPCLGSTNARHCTRALYTHVVHACRASLFIPPQLSLSLSATHGAGNRGVLTNASIYAPEEPCNRAAIKRIGILERPSPIARTKNREGRFPMEREKGEVNGVIDLLVLFFFFRSPELRFVIATRALSH